jgi:peptide/nickel transport system ATP-binding protein
MLPLNPRIDVTAPPSAPLARVRGLDVSFSTRRGPSLHVIRDVSFDLQQGAVLCLLGESGSGKTVTMRSLFRLLPPNARISGEITVAGQNVLAMDDAALRRLRGPVVSMIFQEPATALDPTFTIGAQIIEAIRAHEPVSREEAHRRALELLELVQIPSASRRMEAYPFELSGGLRQRAMIALALSCRPQLLLADEPTTALDATVQIQVLLLLRQLQQQLGMSIVFVTHDIGVACEVADEVAVMYAGQIVEMAPTEALMSSPRHPYTRGLLHSLITPQSIGMRLDPIPGMPPDVTDLPLGCAFSPRCSLVHPSCERTPPVLRIGDDGRSIRCIIKS